ncbi:MAG: hypothetical protein QOE46_2343 [Acidobacteriota bacterium]|nr:hypothetical protein [Acidobacteriota bacterium]
MMIRGIKFMSIARLVFSFIASVVILSGAASAQGIQQQEERPAASRPVVSAAATVAGVRFVSTGGTRRIRLEVYAASGGRLFDSDFRAGSILDWDGAGLADGSYLCIVTSEDSQGALGRSLSGVTLQGGHARVRSEGEEQLRIEYAQTLAAAGGQPQVVEANAGESASTVTAHDGLNGQVTSTSGALTFRTGDVLKGEDKEQVRITPEGQVGIGTSDPQATLDVAGTIRARGGIRFDDGTVLTSAGTASKSAVAAGVVQPKIVAGSTGTTNRVSKWLDAAGTLGDSSITESGGNIGIGTSSPVARLDVAGNTKHSAPAGSYVLGTAHHVFTSDDGAPLGIQSTAANGAAGVQMFDAPGQLRAFFQWVNSGVNDGNANTLRFGTFGSDPLVFTTNVSTVRMKIAGDGNVGIGTTNPTQRLEVAGNLKLSGVGNGLMFPDGTTQTTAAAAGGSMTGSAIVNAINDPATVGVVSDTRVSGNFARLNGANAWSGANAFGNGLSANGALITNVGNPVAGTDAVNKNYVDLNAIRLTPAAPQVSVGDANGTAAMLNIRGGSTCCSGPGGFTPADFKVYQNGSFLATGNLGIGTIPVEGQGYRTMWYTYKGAFRSGYAANEWDDANMGFFSWAGGSQSTASGLYSFAFGDTNFASSTSSIAFGSGNEVKGAAGFSAGAGNRVCDTYGVAFGNKAQSGGPLVSGKCDPDSFNITGLAAVALGFNVTADKDHSFAMGKFASNNGFSGTFVWSDASATASADTFKNTANNEFAARATGGFRFRTNLTGTTGCNLPAGSGVFNCTSSRTTKEHFSLVNGEDVLAHLRKVPVSTWNYISEGQQSRHLGPMAEDFYGAFGLGTSDKAIGIQDAVGVSLAAVKALDARTTELQQKTEEVEQLRSKVNSLELRLAALEQLMQSNAKQPERQEQK